MIFCVICFHSYLYLLPMTYVGFNLHFCIFLRVSLVAQWWRICLQCKRCGFNPWVGKIPCRRKWQPTPVFLLGKPHRQGGLVGYSPWGHKRARHGLATKQQQQHLKEEAQSMILELCYFHIKAFSVWIFFFWTVVDTSCHLCSVKF